jgi:hypothetical protein
MSIRVGETIAVHGVKVTLKIDDDSSKETLFYKGEKYKGVSIREYIYIQRGFREIVCMVEGEHLDEAKTEGDSYGGKLSHVRRVEVKPVGYFEDGYFYHGIKFLPMIKDPAFLMQEKRIEAVYGRGIDDGLVIGRMLKEEMAIGLPWQRLFNSHIGIFGNTGSGKSNTLAKLYTALFDRKFQSIQGKSTFVVLDFNGEYAADQLAPKDRKSIYSLTTQRTGGDRFPLDASEFWDVETLSLLFQATPNTQKPFLVRLVDGRAAYADSPGALSNYAKATFERAFTAGKQRGEVLDLLRKSASLLGSVELQGLLRTVSWNGSLETYYRRNQGVTQYYNADGIEYANSIKPIVDTLDIAGLDHFEQLIVRSYFQLIRELIQGFVQFDHIQPLIKRIESSLSSIRKVVSVGVDHEEQEAIVVISMRKCNSEAKKILPLLAARHYYAKQRHGDSPPTRTTHIIIDEAHNILSNQSSREHESWRDYRLELFEEIIKEGRKFGLFLTICSQRPADISPTIVSQVHNFFIHRLVNDRDLFLVDNTISTLDGLSRSMIPSLAQGCCVVTGTAFELPMIMQVDMLPRGRQPDSEDVDLAKLWGGDFR